MPTGEARRPPDPPRRLKAVLFVENVSLRAAVEAELEAADCDAFVRACAAGALAPDALRGFDVILLDIDRTWAPVLALAFLTNVPEVPRIGLLHGDSGAPPQGLTAIVAVPWARGELAAEVRRHVGPSRP